ncbi:quinolinate synthase NadA [Spirochaetes bacterium]|uniref:Quinolinate synthase n=1 Tax=Candidatus Scatousia excrementipullorum TaxID=2840936 RepID=A0A9D9DPP5_9BACT|nr:quinolinate synthase NadA [Candidatus Scatousia excrementipullorum]
MNSKIIEEINNLKKKKNAVILAHCYQNIEIDEVADFVGDSLYLSQMAAKTEADIIIFAGVYFMAQTAKILNPSKKVILPNKNAGCDMADMINLNQLREFKSKHPDIPVVCYINSTAEVKSECDICCTSSNAVEIVKSLNAPEVLFIPDKNLGRWVEKELGNVKVVTYDGCCPIHNDFKIKDLLATKREYPAATVLAHPECREEFLSGADFVGSTTGIMNYVKNSSKKEFIIATEKGVTERLKRDYPHKQFHSICNKPVVCPSMKLNSLEDIYNSLKNETTEIEVNKEISDKAKKCINRMLEVSKKCPTKA